MIFCTSCWRHSARRICSNAVWNLLQVMRSPLVQCAHLVETSVLAPDMCVSRYKTCDWSSVVCEFCHSEGLCACVNPVSGCLFFAALNRMSQVPPLCLQCDLYLCPFHGDAACTRKIFSCEDMRTHTLHGWSSPCGPAHPRISDCHTFLRAHFLSLRLLRPTGACSHFAEIQASFFSAPAMRLSHASLCLQ